MKSTIAFCILALGFAGAQSVNPPNPVIIGHSFVRMAPWSSIGIPGSWVKGFDSATCPYISAILPALVPPHTPVVVLVEGTNDVARGVPADATASCLRGQISWLQQYRPGIHVVLASVSPMSLGNCDGDYRELIAAYNLAYGALVAQEGHSVRLADITTAITQPDGWALESFMDGPCLLHPGQPGIPNAGWSFFMGQIVAAMAA
jgi:hypothetical protein